MLGEGEYKTQREMPTLRKKKNGKTSKNSRKVEGRAGQAKGMKQKIHGWYRREGKRARSRGRLSERKVRRRAKPYIITFSLN